MSRPMLITLGSVLLASILISPATGFAQKRGGPGVTSTERRETMLGREADLQNRSLTLDLLREPGKTKVLTEDDRKYILKQIFEDFERVQVVNKEMVQASSNPKQLGAFNLKAWPCWLCFPVVKNRTDSGLLR